MQIVPYAKVTNSRLRRVLFSISEHFHFLERGFAEYFRIVGPPLDRDAIKEALQGARMTIESQAALAGRKSSEKVYLGDLGEYCELVFSSSISGIRNPDISSTVTHTRDEILDNLQDTFEVPYWSLIADLFLGMRSNTLKRRSLSTEVVLKVLDSVNMNLHGELRQLRECGEADIMQPFLSGIDERMRVLRSILESTGVETNGKDELLSAMFEKAKDNEHITNDTASIHSGEWYDTTVS